MTVTIAMLDDINARHLEYGFDMRSYTAHKVARELMLWDEAFKSADYTQLVAAITEWQKRQ